MNILTGVYKIVNTKTNKFYIGSAKDINKRYYEQHLVKLRKNIHENIKLQRSYNKHGEDNFSIEIVEICEKDQLFDREQFYLDTLKPYEQGIGYNIGMSACGGDNISMNPKINEIKLKHSINGKRIWENKTKEEKEAYRIKYLGDKNPNWKNNSSKSNCVDCGVKVSPYRKRCLICCKTGKNNHFHGKHHSIKSKNKISKARKGKNTGGDHPLFGIGHSKETKTKMKALSLERYKNQTFEYKLSKKCKLNHSILKYQDKYYLSYVLMAKDLRQDVTTLRFKCRHKSEKWKDYEEIRLNLEIPKETLNFYLMKLKENRANDNI